MTYYGASYLPPTSSSATFDSTSFNRANEALTYQTALDNFLAYPTAQGTENLKTTNISGVLTLTNDLIINGNNYLQFPDGTQQTTAFVEENYAQTNTDNLFLQPFTNTFQGNNSSVGLTAPLVISNSQTSNKASLYIDDANNLDATLYSNQPDGGITIRNAGGFSFTVAPLGANTATFANPISCGTFPLTCGALSATSMTGSSVNISGTVTCRTVNTNTLGVTGNIVTGGSVTGNQLLLGTGTITSGAITSSGAITGTSLILGGTTLSNASGTFASTTTITAPTQTYNSGTTYANILSTQSFVQQALSSQGSGDVSQSGNNAFTGTNTFNVNMPTSTLTQTYPSVNTTQLATIGYVNSITSTVKNVSPLINGYGTQIVSPANLYWYNVGYVINYTFTVDVKNLYTSNSFLFTFSPQFPFPLQPASTLIDYRNVYNNKILTVEASKDSYITQNSITINMVNYMNSTVIYTITVSGSAFYD